jgi:hypothetical protein
MVAWSSFIAESTNSCVFRRWAAPEAKERLHGISSKSPLLKGHYDLAPQSLQMHGIVAQLLVV